MFDETRVGVSLAVLAAVAAAALTPALVSGSAAPIQPPDCSRDDATIVAKPDGDVVPRAPQATT